MNVLSNFTIKNLKLNRKRTIVTAIGIILSTALICAVAGMVTSVRQTMINTIKSDDGDYHTAYYSVPKDELKYIEENQKVSSYFLSSQLGWANLENSKNEKKPYVRVLANTSKAFDNMGLKLKEGRFPENSNEIVISEGMLSSGGLSLNIDDSITLDMGKRKNSSGIELSQNISLIDEKTGEVSDESIVDKEAKTYKIVGIIKRPNYAIESYNCPGFTAFTHLDSLENVNNFDIYVRYINAKQYAENEKNITKDNNYEKKTNTELLRYEGAISEETVKVLYGIAAVVIVIIVVSSIFVIRNSFNISVAEKNKQYGMLSSIGATKKQIRKSVLLEGLIIGAIAIPIGILCGILAVFILIVIMNTLLVSMLNGVTFVYSVPFIPIILTIIMSAITIYLSCLIPSIKAAKISPIDSIRGSNDVKIKAKKLRISKTFKKMFGIGGVIARKNLKRSRKKYRTTIISLVVSVSIFIALSSFISYGKKMTSIYYTDLKFNVVVTSNDTSMYDKVLNLNNIESYAKYESKNLNIDMDKYGTQEGRDAISKFKEKQTTLIVVNDECYKQYLKDIGENSNNFCKTAILVDEFMSNTDNNKKSLENYLNVKDSDNITIGENADKIDIQITKRTDKRPMGYEGNMNYGNCGMIFVSKSYAKNITGLSDAGLYLKVANPSDVEASINEIKAQSVNYTEAEVENLDTYVEQINRLYLIISIFLYGFITVITLIGVTNIFNTITTNMILRSKEFAMLKSIGMTSKEFNKMIRLESIFYGVKSLLIGIPIGLIGSYFIGKSFSQSTDLGYIFPWMPIVISIIFVFIIVGLTMKYSLSKINKQNIIETIRNDNI